MLLQYLFTSSQSGNASRTQGTSEGTTSSANGSATANQKEFNTALRDSINNNKNINLKQLDTSNSSSNVLTNTGRSNSSPVENGTVATESSANRKPINQTDTSQTSNLAANLSQLVNGTDQTTSQAFATQTDTPAASGNTLPETGTAEVVRDVLSEANSPTGDGIQSKDLKNTQNLTSDSQIDQSQSDVLLKSDSLSGSADGELLELETSKDKLQNDLTQPRDKLLDGQLVPDSGLLTELASKDQSVNDQTIINSEQRNSVIYGLDASNSPLANDASSIANNADLADPSQTNRTENTLLSPNGGDSGKSAAELLNQPPQSQFSDSGKIIQGQGGITENSVVAQNLTNDITKQVNTGVTNSPNGQTAATAIVNEGLLGTDKVVINSAVDKVTKETIPDMASRIAERVPTANKKATESTPASETKLKSKNMDMALMKGDAIVTKESDLRLDKFLRGAEMFGSQQKSAAAGQSMSQASLAMNQTQVTNQAYQAQNATSDGLSRVTTGPSLFAKDSALSVNVPKPQWNQRFAERISMLALKGASLARIRLDPPELGPMSVRIQTQGGETSIQFTVNNPVARDLVDSGAQRLREMLEEHGFNSVDVGVKEFANQHNGGANDSDLDEADLAFLSRRDSDLDDEISPIATYQDSIGLIDIFA